MHTALIALADADKRDALTDLVRRASWRAVAVASCTEARRRYPGRDFDVVFVDAAPGGEDGWGRVVHACGLAVLVDPPDHVLVGGALPVGFEARISSPFAAEAVQGVLGTATGATAGTAAGTTTGTGAGSAAGRTASESEALKGNPPPARSGDQPVEEARPGETRMLGDSSSMRKVERLIRSMASTSAPVLITGETGTGKEVVARRLHELSRRRDQPFVAVNCGALSPTLMDSQLFGHERGSFSGADRRHRGVFERADGGTLFLDEVTEMPLDLQARFLRVLEDGVFRRTGGEVSITVDVRTLAATNRVPETAVADGRLRADVYYRLRVLHLPLPPLRERGQDVELLALAFLVQIGCQEGSTKVFTEETLACLRGHSWPGNVRELRNAVHTAYLMAEGREIEPHSLPGHVLLERGRPTRGDEKGRVHVPFGTSIHEAERRLILRTLSFQSGNKTQTARTLGISLKTLYNRLNAYEAEETGPTRARIA